MVPTWLLPVFCLLLLSGSLVLVSRLDNSKKIIIWDTLGEDKCIKLEKMATVGAITDIAWSPDGQRVVVSGTGSGGIHGDAFMIQGGASVGTSQG
jgi:WD40 repeat protein